MQKKQSKILTNSKFKIFLKWVQFIADVATGAEDKYNQHILGIKTDTKVDEPQIVDNVENKES